MTELLSPSDVIHKKVRIQIPEKEVKKINIPTSRKQVIAREDENDARFPPPRQRKGDMTRHSYLMRLMAGLSGESDIPNKYYNRSILSSYDALVSHNIDEMMNRKYMDTEIGRIYGFGSCRFKIPESTRDGKAVKMTPNEARVLGKWYDADVHKSFIVRTPDGRERLFNDGKELNLGQFPVMVGSSICTTNGKTPEQLLAMGECPNDPMTYFITNNGTEKLIISQQKARTNKVLCVERKEKTKFIKVVKITCETLFSSHTISVIFEGDFVGLEMRMFGTEKSGNMNKQKIDKSEVTVGVNVVTIFGIFGYNDEQFLQMVMMFTSHKKKVTNNLLNTILQTKARRTASDESKHVPEDPVLFLDALYKLRKESSGTMDPIDYMRNLVNLNLFPHMNELPQDKVVYLKMLLLASMVAKIVEVKIGLRPLDDIDSWINKKVNPAGKSLEKLTQSGIDRAYDNINKDSAKKHKDSEIAAIIVKRFKEVFEMIRKSISGPNFGIPAYQGASTVTAYSKNITEPMRRTSLIDSISHTRQVNSPTSKNVKKAEVRSVQLTQIGFICPNDTPDSLMCGLTKNLACTTQVSTYVYPTLVFQTVGNRIFSIREHDMVPFVVNGMMLGFVRPAPVRDILMMVRRAGGIPMMSIALIDNELQVYTDDGRLVRPLLVVDDGKVVIETLGPDAWTSMSFEELVRRGAIEYIDTTEQTVSQIDVSIPRFHERERLIEEIRARVVELESQAREIGNFTDEQLAVQVLLAKRQNERKEFIIRTIKNGRTPDTTDIDKEITILKRQSGISDRSLLETQYKELSDQLARTIRIRNSKTHIELDPTAVMSITSAIIPLPDLTYATRVAFQCNMGKQAIGTYHSNYRNRFDVNARVLVYENVPLFKTDMYDMLAMNRNPGGMSIVAGFGILGGENQEDALIFNRAAIDSGKFDYMYFRIFESKPQSSISGKRDEIYGIPPDEKYLNNPKFRHIDPETGVARKGSYLTGEDCVISKYILIRGKPGEKDQIQMVGEFMDKGDKGTVAQILKTKTSGAGVIVRVKVIDYRRPVQGDKFAARYSQKGVIGRIYDPEDMPFSEVTGTNPDVWINPAAIPGRMTIGWLWEMLLSKIAIHTGEFFDATAFRNVPFEDLMDMLVNFGFSSTGEETYHDGMTGELISASMYTGVFYELMLKHTVLDKRQSRGDRGRIDKTTRGLTGGRQTGSANKIGEMEQAAMLTHGVFHTTLGRTCLDADKARIPICTKCGEIAILRANLDNFVCTVCAQKNKIPEEETIPNIGVLTISYISRLISQYLQGLGVTMRFTVAPAA